RVQSVAVRLVVDREQEIKKFIPVEYWQIIALVKRQETRDEGQVTFEAHLIKKDGKVLDKLEIKNKAEADDIIKNLENATYQIQTIERKETKRNPLPPFTTSTLQQTA